MAPAPHRSVIDPRSRRLPDSRLGVSGDDERDQEESARSYLAEHGRWPDEDDRQGGHP